MQVFKLFFKILKSQLGLMIMYVAIFAGISQMVSNLNTTPTLEDYEETSLEITISDNDNSTASAAFKEFLLKNNKEVVLDDLSEETIQDELYYRNTSNVLIIPAGFEENLIAGKTDKMLDIYNVPDTMASNVFTNRTNTYISTVSAYIAGGYSLDEAITKTETSLAKKADVNITATTADAGQNPLSLYLTYIAYVFIAIAVTGVSPIIQVFNKPELRKRFNCSPYKTAKSSFEIMGATAIVGLGICAAFIALTCTLYGDMLFTTEGMLSLVNMSAYMLISLSIAYLIGTISSKAEIIPMMANIISLGCSFLGGVFVPLELLGNGIIKLAHFLPSYWYITAKDSIFSLANGGSYTAVWSKMGVEVLFAILFFLIGLIVQRYKRSAA